MKDLTKKRLRRTFGIIIDVVIMLALLSSMAIAIIVVVQRANNGFAGYGTVQSGSMKASGLNIGDVVRVTPQDEYVKGDIIVFYRAPDQYGDKIDHNKLHGCEIWIHEVIDIREDDLGRATYLTKGSSNSSDDGAYVPQDFVLGKATKLNQTLISFINFVCSVQGIILLVEIPCGIVLVYLVWDLVMFLTGKKPDEKKPQVIEDDENGEEE